ncbi:MAG: hypothetical protein JW981_08990 [Anaerolineae bacterium]|nr:hypothetical protein [Anaerolineae bacterium]
MQTALLSTKLYIPAPRGNLVARPYLCTRLDAALHQGHKLTLVSAPAGFGKTTLLSNWAYQQAAGRQAVAWLSLDEGDNDPARFLAYLVAALRSVQIDVRETTIAALQAPKLPSLDSVMTTLINAITAQRMPETDKEDTSTDNTYILILDDYHLITTQPVHDALTFLLDHLPPNLHMVIATRADPPLPIARLRGKGQLTELRQSDLRFTEEEAAAFLNTHTGLNLSPVDVTALETRTEGWIAGLQLAALSMRGHEDAGGFIQAFTGSDRYILDYLVEEVLQRQPEEVQAFLLQTAILERLTGPLCDAVINTPGPEAKSGQETLWQLDRANLFIVPLDNERRWFRYHRLFSDLLRRRLQQREPGLVPILHRRASVWFEENGLTTPAIDHMLQAGDFETAAHMIEQAGEATLMRSEIVTFLGWVDKLPDALIRERPSLCIFQAWAYLLAGRSQEAIDARLQDAAVSEAGDKTGPIRALLALYQGRISHALELAQEALEQLGEGDMLLRNLATWILGLCHMIDGNLATSTQTLEKVAQTSYKAGNVMVAVMVLCNIAELSMHQAQLHQAQKIYQQAIGWATDEQGQLLPVAGEALMGLGRLFYQWNDLETATHYVLEGIELTRQWGETGAMDGYITLSHIKQAQGDMDGARDVLQEAEKLALRTDTTELDDILVAAYQVHLWIAQGNLGAALGWLEERGLVLESGELNVDIALSELEERVKDDFFRTRRRRTAEYTALVQALLMQGQADKALAVLEPLIAIAQQWELKERLIRFQILKALAFHTKGDMARGVAALGRALSIAEPAGYIRPFLDKGKPMAQLLYLAAGQGIAPEYTGQLLAAFPVSEPGKQDSQIEMVEPLSERELDILPLLAEGLSNQEIAQRLFISLRTVKWHTGNIYSKLGVKNRTQAVSKARALGILPNV